MPKDLSDIKIEKNVKPSSMGVTSKWKILIDKMEIGDSVVLNLSEANYLVALIRKCGFQGKSQRVSVEKNEYRVWKLNKNA